ncbi:Ubiquitin carboxyl-terminal hydrolase 10 [Triticum urartu]|uniref:Ubiquitin carboxyl-terminal hydrolase 10 n=1 Tax=Triticum urartu TaxID=4572 RepID=M7ZGR2_TRIUA|nr:Ubiquitin carboxyl-terminal hydrolase 10 [Triticum urartu]
MTIPSAEGFLPAASCLPCTAEEERATVDALTREADANVKNGDLRYLISQSWWTNWQSYVGLLSYGENDTDIPLQPASRPGEIDNRKLVLEETSSGSEDTELQRTLREGEDYTLVPQDVWRKLYDWYKGGPEISRKVICEDPASRRYIVDVYPLHLTLIDERDNSARTIKLSRKAKVSELYRLVCSLLSVEQSKVHIWDHYQKLKNKKLTNRNETLEEAQLLMDQEACNFFAIFSSLAEIPSFLLYAYRFSWSLSQDNSLNPLVRDTEDGYSNFSNGTKDDIHGLTGLHNLGNTCFMNSAIQSLVHTPPLVEYFLKEYTQEINTENPLGLQGELAVAFAELLRKLWTAGRTSVPPRAFKSKLSRFAPQFSGYNQHDSQVCVAQNALVRVGPSDVYAISTWKN